MGESSPLHERQSSMSRRVPGKIAVAISILALVALTPADAAVTSYNPFDIPRPEGSDPPFTMVSAGDVSFGNGELEGSAASFGTVENVRGSHYPLIHVEAGTGDYAVPIIDSDPT